MRTNRRLAVFLVALGMLPLWTAAEVTAGPPCHLKPDHPACSDSQPDSGLVEFDMYLDEDGEFVIEASGPAVDGGPMCTTADELARVDQSARNKFQLYVLFVCVPYTPWNPDLDETVPSDVCHRSDPESCFTVKLQGKTGGTNLSWILYNGTGELSGLQGTGKGAVIEDDHYLLWGELK